MNIQVVIKNNYGSEAIYPVCDKSKAIADLLKQKTFTRRDIEKLKVIGFKIEVIQDVKVL